MHALASLEKSAGNSTHAPRYENSIFEDQADVDFVENHSKDLKRSENVGKNVCLKAIGGISMIIFKNIIKYSI